MQHSSAGKAWTDPAGMLVVRTLSRPAASLRIRPGRLRCGGIRPGFMSRRRGRGGCRGRFGRRVLSSSSPPATPPHSRKKRHFGTAPSGQRPIPAGPSLPCGHRCPWQAVTRVSICPAAHDHARTQCTHFAESDSRSAVPAMRVAVHRSARLCAAVAHRAPSHSGIPGGSRAPYPGLAVTVRDVAGVLPCAGRSRQGEHPGAGEHGGGGHWTGMPAKPGSLPVRSGADGERRVFSGGPGRAELDVLTIPAGQRLITMG